jgi:hypothetical protein
MKSDKRKRTRRKTTPRVRHYPPRLFCVFQGGATDPFHCGADRRVAMALVTIANTTARDYHITEYVHAPNSLLCVLTHSRETRTAAQ